MNQPVKLLSPPILVDSTRFSLYAITEVSRKPKHTHFKSSLQNILFLCAVLPRSRGAAKEVRPGARWIRAGGGVVGSRRRCAVEGVARPGCAGGGGGQWGSGVCAWQRWSGQIKGIVAARSWEKKIGIRVD